ncbi:MAG: hypothetical protein IJV82_06145 [Oscillospiraceae bacterium]|nr:hypothetical protein [Oscillospiraceae bacterium]
MKRRFALLLALVMVLSMAACSKEKNENPQKEEGDGLVSVWLCTSETAYEADGSRGRFKRTYTYTEDGLPLTMESDQGLTEEVWDEEIGVFRVTLLPYDDTLNEKVEYFYNDRGDLLYYTWDYYSYDEEGNLTDTKDWGEGKDTNYTYHYDEQGRITSVDMYPVKAEGGHGDEVASIMHCAYDDKGQLVEVYTENLADGRIFWSYDYRYNQDGQLIGASKRPLEGVFYRRYQYNDQGQLTQFSLTTDYNHTPIDDQHVAEPYFSHGAPLEDQEPRDVVNLEYDSQGRLTARGEDKLYYDDQGQLERVDYGTTVRYVDQETEAGPDELLFLRDANGNVVKIINENGQYIELEYQEFRLTEAQARKCNNIRLMNNRNGSRADRDNYFIRFSPGCGFMCYLPLVETAITETDYLYDRVEGKMWWTK